MKNTLHVTKFAKDFAVKFQLNIFVQNPGEGERGGEGRGKETK